MVPYRDGTLFVQQQRCNAVGPAVETVLRQDQLCDYIGRGPVHGVARECLGVVATIVEYGRRITGSRKRWL